MKRELGYYWCKFDGDWYIGEYCLQTVLKEYVWWICGFPMSFKEEELDEVDEKMIPKHE